MKYMCMTVWPTRRPTWETPQRPISASAACCWDTTTLSLCRPAACSTVSCVENLHCCSITSSQQVQKHIHTSAHRFGQKNSDLLFYFYRTCYFSSVQGPVMRLVERATQETWQQWWSPSSSCCCSECAEAWWCSTFDTADCRTILLPSQTPITTPAWALPSSPPGTNWVRQLKYFCSCHLQLLRDSSEKI